MKSDEIKKTEKAREIIHNLLMSFVPETKKLKNKMASLSRYRAIDETQGEYKNWIPYSTGTESMSQYSGRVFSHILQYALTQKLPLSNAHGIGFNQVHIRELIENTIIVEPLQFSRLGQDKQAWRDDVWDEEDFNEDPMMKKYIDATDILMKLFDVLKDATFEFASLLNTIPRITFLWQGLTGKLLDVETFNSDPERFRILMNITFAYYSGSLLQPDLFSPDVVEFNLSNVRNSFASSDNTLTNFIRSKYADLEFENGTATRNLFSDRSHRICCSADTGTSAHFKRAYNKYKRPRVTDPGLDLLKPTYSALTFLHYGKNLYPSIAQGDRLINHDFIYASMSPRWQWDTDEQRALYILRVAQTIHCDLIQPPNYAELTILPEEETGMIKTALLPSVKLGSALWIVTSVDDIPVSNGKTQKVICCDYTI